MSRTRRAAFSVHAPEPDEAAELARQLGLPPGALASTSAARAVVLLDADRRPVAAGVLYTTPMQPTPDAARIENVALRPDLPDPDAADGLAALAKLAADAARSAGLARGVLAIPADNEPLHRAAAAAALAPTDSGPYKPTAAGAVEYLHGYTSHEGFFIDYQPADDAGA